MPHGVLFENELWLVRHSAPPYGVAGWITLQAKRHVAGPGYFSDAEAASFGVTLRHISKLLQDITGSLRLYIAAMGESYPHFHCHLVPRYDDGVKGWAVFGQPAEAAAGRVQIDEGKVLEIVGRLKEGLAANPPPLPGSA